MKRLKLQSLLVASLLFAGCHVAMAKTVEVSLGGVNYSLGSESQTAAVKSATDVSGDIVLPESVSYGDKAYTLTSVGEEAFTGCSDITSLSIPSSVTSIGAHAFYGCTSLTSVNIPSGVTSIGQETFYFCSNLTSVTIPSSVTSIGDKAFYYCKGLTSVSLPSSVTSIENYAFYGCSGLTSITIPSSVAFIGEGAFWSCEKVESIVVEDGNKFYDSRDNCNAIVETATNKLLQGCMKTTLPYGIASIGKEAFFYLDITSIDIPSSVTSIEDEAFSFCTNLTSVTIPSSVTSMGINPFFGCSSMQTFTVEDGNKFYDSRNGCNAIIETATGLLVSGCSTSTIPYGVTAIGEKAFEGRGLYSIDIPSSVTSIGKFAFLLSDLTSLDIPSSVKSIGESAFSLCLRLTSVTLRSSAISLEERAFYSSSIKDVYIYGSEMVENCADNAFGNIEDDATLHVDASLVDKYKATSPWCDWFADIVALDGETGIENAEANAPETYRIYSVDGKNLPMMQKGLNILRSKTGKSVKVVK